MRPDQKPLRKENVFLGTLIYTGATVLSLVAFAALAYIIAWI